MSSRNNGDGAESMQLNMYADVELDPQEDRVVNLLELVEMLKDGSLELPPHQRELVWIDEKKQNWIKRVQKAFVATRPVGAIATYQLDNGRHSPLYLNDGSQRIRTCLEYLMHPELYGDTPERARDILRKCGYPRQHRWYKTHDEALVDFQLLNMGTKLTPYELCSGVLLYANESVFWTPIFGRLHDIVTHASQRLHCQLPRKRETIHKYRRHDYALLLRFLSKDITRQDYGAHVDEEKFDNVKAQKVVEWRLRLCLESMTHSDIEQDIKRFENTVNQETALVMDTWRRIKADTQVIDPNAALTSIAFRYLLDCAIWRKNNRVDPDIWRDFVERFLRHTEGGSQITNPHNSRGNIHLGFSKLGALPLVCKIVGSPMVLDTPAPPKRSKQRLRKVAPPGFDVSHKKPFSSNGEGEVFLEPAGINRSRGAVEVQK